MVNKIKDLFIGKAKNPLDAGIFHQLSLVAFMAWVGLGADGLSSSAYGPEELYRALGGQHEHLALYLALATAITVFVISASYSQIIKLFPAGGGGYVVASKLLGPDAGVISGAALVVDYVLTISLSIAASADAVFSFLPMAWAGYKVLAEAGLILALIWMNMRGLKESIQFLVPIFLLFVVTHIILITWSITGHSSSFASEFHSAGMESRQMIQSVGWFGFLSLLLKAYSMGAGTYTGIEAVSNGLSDLREPRVQTGRRTMVYMAISLSLTAGGILLGYMLWDLQIPHRAHQTLNARLCEVVMGRWHPGGWPLGQWLVYLTLIAESLLLFVAAQTGFVGGPNTLSNMAVDSWVPSRFGNLSNRLVRLNGILVMGLASLAILVFAHGSVHMMVVLYAINVFITFTLSQLSMCLHWLQVRKTEKGWLHRFAINGVGLLLTSLILVITAVLKFGQGGWVTLVITGGFIGLCYLIKQHYRNVWKALRRLDQLLINLPYPTAKPVTTPLNPKLPTAVLMVSGYNGLGIHSIYSIRKLFQEKFKNFIFVTVGRIDSSKFKGVEEIENLRHATEDGMQKYVELARRMGYAGEYRYTLGTDVITELEKLCREISTQYSDSIYFAGKLIFAKENFFSRFLHNETAMELQRRLLFEGNNMVIVPIRVL